MSGTFKTPATKLQPFAPVVRLAFFLKGGLFFHLLVCPSISLSIHPTAHLSIYRSAHPSVHSTVHSSSVHPFTRTFIICPSVHHLSFCSSSIRLFIRPSVHLTIHLSVHPAICPFCPVCKFVHLCRCVSSTCLSVHLHICQSVCPYPLISVALSVCPSGC